MKWLAAVVLVLLLALAGWLFFGKRQLLSTEQTQPVPNAPAEITNAAAPSARTSPSPSVTTSDSTTPLYPAPPAGKITVSTAPTGSLVPEITSIAPDLAAAAVRTAIRQYGDMFGGDPVGTNPEITSALNGHNPKQINFINAESGMRVNDQGQLIDVWGTPYFFHQISGKEMEIHSAGPDHIMWTADDIVAR
jgi:hypothetical protein